MRKPARIEAEADNDGNEDQNETEEDRALLMCRGRGAWPVFTKQLLSASGRAFKSRFPWQRATMQVHIVRAPARRALASSISCWQADSSSLSFGQDGGNALVCQHIGQAVGAKQERVSRRQVGLSHVDLDAGVVAAENVGDDVPPLVGADLFRLDDSPAGHFGRNVMVESELEEFAAAPQVTAAVSGVDHEQRPAADEGHRQGGPHARPLRMMGGLFQ